MIKHILLDNLKFKTKTSIVPSAEFQYDRKKGSWVSSKDKSLLVAHKSFINVGSKKRDIETGEDQK